MNECQDCQRRRADERRNSRDMIVVGDGRTAKREIHQTNENRRPRKVFELSKLADRKEANTGEQQRCNQTRGQQGQKQAEQANCETEERRMNQVQLVVEKLVFGKRST